MNLKSILFLAFFSFIALFVNAQTGLNFQGVARSSNNTILASQPISLRLSILQGSANGMVEYVEVRKVNTNAQGLFSVVIGDEEATNTIGSISNINWKNTPKFLKIEMDAAAGNNFTIVGTTQFQYVAYAQFAKSVDAENIAGIIPVEKGGTGVASISALKTALAIDKSNIGLSKVDNTADSSKPISALTKAALDTKVSSETFSSSIGLKAPIESPTFTGTVNGITKTMVGLNNVDNTSDLLKPISTATQVELDTKVSTTTYSNTIVTKENISNKSSATDLGGLTPSDILYPTQKAVKSYITANNVNGGVADGGITTNKLADAAVSFQKFQSIPSNTILGNTSSSTSSIQTINTTGVDNVVLSSNPIIQSPTLVTPTIGDATATSIVFNNGSKVGDIQNFIKGNPDTAGSIDLYAPDGAKWVQLNYANRNYISLGTNFIGFWVDENEWDFDENGITVLPGHVFNKGNIYFSKNGISNKPNASIESIGPQLKFKARLFDSVEWNHDDDYGIELNYADRSILQLKKNWMNFYNEDDDSTNDDYLSSVDFNYNSFNFFINNKEQQFSWLLNEDGSTALPGKLTVSQKTSDDFGLTITSPRPEKPIIQDPDKLGSSIGFISDINSGTTSNTAFIQLNPQGDMIFRTLQQKMSFQNYGNGTFEYKFKIPEDISNNIPEHTKTTLSINNDNVYIDGTLTIGNTNYPKLGGDRGQVLTMDSTGLNAIWITPTNTVTSTSNITLINGVASGSQSLTTGNSGTDFSIVSDVITGVHTFNLPDASTTNRGLLTSSDYLKFDNKQNALTHPLTGTGTIGQISFFNGTSTVTSSSNLFWDATNKRLGVGTQSPGYPIEINTGAANYGLMISSESTNTWGSGIGFKSSTDVATKTGLFQLDRDGAMVFRTLQDNMYFDNAGTGSMIFRMGNPNSNIGMTLTNSGNLEINGEIKTGNVIYPKQIGNNGDVLTFDSLTNKAIWKAPAITNSTVTVEASTLSGTTLNTTITGSSLTRLGILNSATVNGKVIVGATSEVSSSAIIEASSTSKGFLPPRMSYYQRNQIESPVAGLTIWCNNCGASGEMQVFNGGAWTNMIGGITTSPVSLSIGDSYQGGKVAYILQSGDVGYDANTQHGLIAATSDQGSRIMWYNGLSSNTGATATIIGAGLSNTKLIISNQGAIITDYAAGVARSYNGGGYNDWYLPSIEELKKLYQNRVAIGGFSSYENYWSSTEFDNIRAALCDFFDDGRVVNFDKYARCLVRAVRSF